MNHLFCYRHLYFEIVWSVNRRAIGELLKMRGFFQESINHEGGFKWRKWKRADGLKRWCYSKWSFEEHTPEAVTDHIDLSVFFLLVLLQQHRFLVLMSSSCSFAKAKGFSIFRWMKNKKKGHFVLVLRRMIFAAKNRDLQNVSYEEFF